jgi:DNA-binding NarL/FixJ family response regulator
VAITVLVVDDQEMVRAGFSALLNAQADLEVVGQAGDGAEAVELAAELHPDVILMDVRMPVMDGLAATRQILATAASGDSPRVVMLTTFDLDDYVYAALRAGASGFLLKHSTPDELAAAVRIVAAGDALLAPSVTRRLVEDFARAQPVVPITPVHLTPRETDVLRLVARGLSNRQIAAELVLAEQTVKTHVSNILTKLDLRDRAQAVVYAYEVGVVVPGPRH